MPELKREQIAQALAQADAALDSSELTRADYFARSVLETDAANGPAWNVLGIVAGMLGLYDHAERYFRAAMDNGFTGASSNLAQVAGLPRPAQNPQERYLLIKAWGFGFWSDVADVVGGLLLAEMTHRTPIVHWGANSRFGEGHGADAFARYFQPVSKRTLVDIPTADADFFPPKWNARNLHAQDNAKWEGDGARVPGLYFLARPEQIAVADFYLPVADLVPWIAPEHRLFGRSVTEVYRALFEKYLKPQPRILAAVEDFATRHFGTAPVIAVHLRGSDKRAEMVELEALNATYGDVVAREDTNARIFLLTDDSRWLAQFRERFGARIVATDSLRTGNEQGIHYARLDQGARLGDEVMIDAYLATRAQRFIGNGRSNVSAMIALLKDWPEGCCTLLAPSQLCERSGT
jgi:hypothetical protein